MRNKKIIAIVALVLIVAMLAVVLTACGPSSIEKAKAKMEKKGYTVLAGKVDGEKIVGSITCSKGLFKEALAATLYKSSKDAKQAKEDLGKGKVIGKWLVVGTDEAIKDFK